MAYTTSFNLQLRNINDSRWASTPTESSFDTTITDINDALNASTTPNKVRATNIFLRLINNDVDQFMYILHITGITFEDSNPTPTTLGDAISSVFDALCTVATVSFMTSNADYRIDHT